MTALILHINAHPWLWFAVSQAVGYGILVLHGLRLWRLSGI